MLKDVFNKKNKYASITVSGNKEKPIKQDYKILVNDDGTVSSNICPSCSSQLSELELLRNYNVCPECSYHRPISSWERLKIMLDENSFTELDSNLSSYNPLSFPVYEEKIVQAEKSSGLKEAIITGQGLIDGSDVVIGVMDPRFMMGSMGSVVGEKIVRAVDKAIELNCPLILCTASGGARMQEGMLSLMQMASTSAALARLNESGLLYISLLTHPTTGGVSASFASLADIIIAEPGALIGFTGPRVIEQTIGQKLPDGFQRAEFLQEHGMIDLIVNRSDLYSTLSRLIRLHRSWSNG